MEIIVPITGIISFENTCYQDNLIKYMNEPTNIILRDDTNYGEVLDGTKLNFIKDIQINIDLHEHQL